MSAPSGIQFPIQFRNGGLAQSSGDLHIKEAIALVLSIAKGEFLLLPQYGCNLHNRTFEPAYATSLAEHDIRAALQQWVPSVVVESITTDISEAHQGIAKISVNYRVKQTGEPGTAAYSLRS